MFISSFSAFSPMQPLGMYAVSKTALLGLTKALAAELGHSGIRCNAIAPGLLIRTHYNCTPIGADGYAKGPHALLSSQPPC